MITYFRAAVLTCMMLLLAGTAQSDTVKQDEFEWDEVTDSDWAVAEDSSYDGYDAVIIFEKVDDDDTEYNKEKHYRKLYRRIRILNDNGRRWADVQVPLVHIKQEIEAIQARTFLPDGTILPLEEKNLFKKNVLKGENIEFEQYSFSMPGVTDNCIIEYIVKYKTKIPVGQWFVQHDLPLKDGQYNWIYFDDKIFIKYYYFVFSYRLTPNFVWINWSGDTETKQISNEDKPNILQFSIKNVPPFRSEPCSPPDVSLKTQLLCYYGSDASSEYFWSGLAQGFHDGALDFCKKDYRIEDVVDSIDELQSDEEKVDAVHNWIQSNIINYEYEDILDEHNRKKSRETMIISMM